MSLENLNDTIGKLDAVTNYSKVKNEKAELEHKVENLQSQILQLQNENLNYKDLKLQFAGREISLEEFEGERQDYTRKFYGEELGRKAQEKFEAESQVLMVKELNSLLRLPREKRPQTLNSCIDTDINAGVDQVLKTPNNWPRWFKQYIDETTAEAVGRQLTDIYWANVREGIRKAKDEEWHPYLDGYTRETITPFCHTVLLRRFISQLINQQISLTCNQCKTQWVFQLNHENVVDLLEKGTTIFTCSTPNCIEGIINRHQTYIYFSLGEAISMLLGNPQMPTLKVNVIKI